MYQKLLVPLEDSEDSRSIVNALSGLVAEDGEAILFHVIPPGKTKGVGEFVILGTQIEEDERARAMVQLNRLSDKLSGASIRSTSVAMVSNSVAGCIVDYTSNEGVDLIAMYTHGRKGLAKLLKGSVTQDVKQRTSIEVRAFASSELAKLAAR